jgi:hypothetical protein
METSRLFMPLLMELRELGNGSCYKHVAPNGALARQPQLFNRATHGLNTPRTVILNEVKDLANGDRARELICTSQPSIARSLPPSHKATAKQALVLGMTTVSRSPLRHHWIKKG